jgi:hypothetical protein
MEILLLILGLGVLGAVTGVFGASQDGEDTPPDNANELRGTAGDDTLRGTYSTPDVLLGLAGDDVLFALGGFETPGDTLYGGEGNDSLYGNVGSPDALYGGEGNDLLEGGGHDSLYGGAGNDEIRALGGATAYGGEGDDFIELDDGFLSCCRFRGQQVKLA